MAQDWAVAFYHSRAWVKTRKIYDETPIDTPWGIIPPHMCERCYENGDLVPSRVVHHKIHLTPNNIDDPNISLNFDNLQRLCVDCHAAVHKGIEKSRCRFDAQGNLIRGE